MLKDQAISLFGTRRALAENLGVSVQRISQLPDELPKAVSDRVIGAAVRAGIPVDHLLDAEAVAQ